MRGTIFGIVALGAGLAIAPAALNGETDATGSSISNFLGVLDPVVGLTFFLAVMGLLIAFFMVD